MPDTTQVPEVTGNPDAPEVTDERIYADLKAYHDAGMLDYVLPTDPIGEQWIVGWKGQILKFLTREGVVGFLTGIQVAALFAAGLRPRPCLDVLTRVQVDHCRRTVARYREENPRGKGVARTLASQAAGLLEIIDGMTGEREFTDGN